MLKLEQTKGEVSLIFKTGYQNKRKLVKAFLIALACHLSFFALFFPRFIAETFQPLSPPIIAYVDEPPPDEDL